MRSIYFAFTCIIEIKLFSTFYDTFETTLPTKYSKLGLLANVASGEISCFCLLRGCSWSLSQLLVVNKVFSLSFSSLISNVLLIAALSKCDCLLSLTFSLQVFLMLQLSALKSYYFYFYYFYYYFY